MRAVSSASRPRRRSPGSRAPTSSSTSTSSNAIAASAGDFVATQMPSRVIAIQSPATMGPHSAPLSRTACVTSPARTRPAASSIAATFSSSDAWASYTTSAASASTTAAVGTTVDRAIGELGHLARHGHDVLVVGQHDHAVGRAPLDRFEDLRGRRVHRLPTGHDLLHAEAGEELLAGRRPPPPRRLPVVTCSTGATGPSALLRGPTPRPLRAPPPARGGR